MDILLLSKHVKFTLTYWVSSTQILFVEIDKKNFYI